MDNSNKIFKINDIKTSGRIFSKVLLEQTNQKVNEFLRNQNYDFISDICDLDHNLNKELFSLNCLIENFRSITNRNSYFEFQNQINNVLNNLINVDHYSSQIIRLKEYLNIQEPDFTLTENDKRTLENIDKLNTKVNDFKIEINQIKQEIDKRINDSESLNKKKEYLSSCLDNTCHQNFNDKRSLQINENILKIKEELESANQKPIAINIEQSNRKEDFQCCLLLDYFDKDQRLRNNDKLKIVELKSTRSLFAYKPKLEIDEDFFKDTFNNYFILIRNEYDSIKLDLKKIDNILNHKQPIGQINFYIKTNANNMKYIKIPSDLKTIKVIRSSEISLRKVICEIENLNQNCDKRKVLALNFEMELKNVKKTAIEKLEQSFDDDSQQKENLLKLREENKAKTLLELDQIEQTQQQNEKEIDMLNQKNIQLLNNFDYNSQKLEEENLKKENIRQRLEHEKAKNKENNCISWLIINMDLFEKLLVLLKNRREYLVEILNTLKVSLEHEPNGNFLLNNQISISKLGQLVSYSYMYEEKHY